MLSFCIFTYLFRKMEIPVDGCRYTNVISIELLFSETILACLSSSDKKYKKKADLLADMVATSSSVPTLFQEGSIFFFENGKMTKRRLKLERNPSTSQGMVKIIINSWTRVKI